VHLQAYAGAESIIAAIAIGIKFRECILGFELGRVCFKALMSLSKSWTNLKIINKARPFVIGHILLNYSL
jgi:hypothetical protein